MVVSGASSVTTRDTTGSTIPTHFNWTECVARYRLAEKWRWGTECLLSIIVRET